MANKINFITGETYTLSELFSGDRRIIIPDLQRDYCWGDENNIKSTGEKGELVTDFVNNLLGQFNEYKEQNDKGCLNLGLFYGYEVPANHIQLCDGQQRLTTLFLLLGMINKKAENKFRPHLISDFEYKLDDKEPYLNYAIRETSLYFLSDLVCNFFIGNTEDTNSITSTDWYFADYGLDPSIQSIIKTLSIIESILNEKNPDMFEFGDWLLNKVTFLYFDMENRKNGEETFVVINTTGESLSSTQNLKPLVISEKNGTFDNTTFNNQDIKVDQCWEEIETWFWKNRKGDNDTADAGFAEFLRWISIIEQIDKEAPKEDKTENISYLFQLILQGKRCDFPYKEISFEKIYCYWKAVVWLFAEKSNFSFSNNFLSPTKNKDVNNRNAIGQNDCFVLLPVLKYVCQNIADIEPNTEKQRNAKRIYEFFKNVIRIDNVSKGVNALVADSIKIIDILNNGDISSLIDSDVDTSKISTQILTNEENIKLKILRTATYNREEIENAFWSAQEHQIWRGEILPMIKWATADGASFDINLFNNYKNKFEEIFKGECNSNIDDVRRALLTKGLKDYPRIFNGYANYSFGWNWCDWQILINDNIDKFKRFFDDLSGESLQQMIDKYGNQGDKYYRFVKHPELLKYCEQKNVQDWDQSICLVKQHKATKYLELETFCLYLDYIEKDDKLRDTPAFCFEKGIQYNGWKMWLYQDDSSALVFEKDWQGSRVAIDVHYNRTKTNDWDIQLFLRSGDSKKKLEQIAKERGLVWNGESERYELKDLSKEDVKDKIKILDLETTEK